MSETRAPPTPFSAEETPSPGGTAPADPLGGDWSEGLPEPVRAHGIPRPKLISLNGSDAAPLATPAVDEPAYAAPAMPGDVTAPSSVAEFDVDITPPSPAPAFLPDDPPQGLTPPDPVLASDPPSVFEDPPESEVIPAPEPPPPANADASDVSPAEVDSPAPADSEWEPEDSAPTPWSEPVTDAPAVEADSGWGAPVANAPPESPPAGGDWSQASATDAAPELAPPTVDGWETPAPPAGQVLDTAPVPAETAEAWAPAPIEQASPPDEAWSAALPAEPVEEWQSEAAAPEFETATPAAADVHAAAADWSSLRTGPDWAAPTAPADATEASPDAWGAPPPVAQSAWAAAAAAPESQGPTLLAEAAPTAPEWDAPAETPRSPGPAPAWNTPAVGASALEQLDSEPPEPEPGAAKELFGTVPSGGMLSGEHDEFAPPEELASPEEVLRPVAIDHEDPDLPAATGEPAKSKTRAQPLAAFRPAALGALEVHGEHRVAVHTRGGRTLRGTMRDIDLSKSQFPLVPQGGGEPEAIYHSDVKAIFFMMAPGEKPDGGEGAKVRVTFADGRVIEGVRDGADAKNGFFLVPLDAARTNTRRIYIARAATSDIKDG